MWAARQAGLVLLLSFAACHREGHTSFLIGAAPVDAGASVPADAAVAAPPESEPVWSSTDVVALGAQDILQTYCADCHLDGDNGAGFAGALDLASLIERGLIVPGAGASSPLVRRITDGSMPPATPGRSRPPRPSVGEIAVLATSIDQLPTRPAPACEPLPLLGRDAIYAALLADVQGLPAGDRPFTRYLGVADASDAMRCGLPLAQQRQALFKLVNSLSMTSALHLPAAVDDAALLYRIDIRDYGWARAIDLDDDGDTDQADGWAALLAGTAPYAVELVGPEASALTSETGTPVPFLPVGAFVQAASTGDLYRALLGVRANIYDTEVELGLDIQQADLDGELRRAAFHRDAPDADMIVVRDALGPSRDRAYWWLDVDDDVAASSIYDDPLELYRGRWRQTIWDLPNGLHAYAMNLANGTAVSQVPRGCIESSCLRPQDVHAVACMGCHSGGLLPLKDDIVRFVDENQEYFDQDTLDSVHASYLPAPELDALIAADNARYTGVLAQLGISADAPDPVSRVYLDFDRPLDLGRAAAELGVPASELAATLGSLPSAFAPLAEPSSAIERAAFGTAYVDALCALQTRNRPQSCP